MKPQRIQLRRTKGWRMPPNTIVVSRPTWLGNPFKVGVHGTQQQCVDLYRYCLRPPQGESGGAEWTEAGGHFVHLAALQNPRTNIWRHLRGQNLACWCPLDQPCHADVLLELANS